MKKSSAHAALGLFVRTRRTELAVPQGPVRRRRTPGLRREELADRAHLSVSWITWIEQARPVSVSPAALGRLAVALELAPAGRRYLFELAGRVDPEEPQIAQPGIPEMQQVVDGVNGPAYVLDYVWNLVCMNAAAVALFGVWGQTGAAAPNLMRFMFTDPNAAVLVPDWNERAGRLIAEFRADVGSRFQEPAVQELLRTLKQASDFFRQAWTDQLVEARSGGQRRFHHPALGLQCYEQRTFRDAARADLKLVMLLPVQC